MRKYFIDLFQRITSVSIFGLYASAFLIFASPLSAQTNTNWIGGASGVWNSAANWSGGFVPNNGAGGTNWNVFIDNGNPTDTTVDLNASFTINQLNVDAGDTLNILNFQSLTINNTGQVGAGLFNNNGSVNVVSTGSNSDLFFVGTTSISGNGTITLVGTGNARIRGSGTLTHGANHTIRGTGNVGSNVLQIVNQGTILADAGHDLILDPANAGTGIAGFDNQGTVRASSGGLITLTGSGGGEFHGSGLYEAQAGSAINLVNSAVIRNTTFNTAGSGQINVLNFQNSQWHDVSNLGNTFLRNGATLDLHGTIDNQGTLQFDAAGSATELRAGSAVTLTGGGNIVLNNSNARIAASSLGLSLTNIDNTISGTGNVGVNTLRVINQGLIQADAGHNLVINPADAGIGNFGLDNQGTVQATGGGVITLTGNGGGEFHGSGVYEALDGSAINLIDSAVVRNTTFNTAGSGQINVLNFQYSQWHDVSNLGNTFLRNGATLDLHGTIDNQGTLQFDAAGSATELRAGSSVTLTGGGNIVLNNSNARIAASSLGLSLTNIDNTISGTGNVGVNTLRVINQGLIQADAGHNLVINPADAGIGNFGLDNQGTVQATGGGVITLTGNGGGEFHGSGVYEALAGSAINLVDAAVVRNTTFNTTGSGQINVNNFQNSQWHNVNNLGNTFLRNGATLDLHGTIDNQGMLQFDAAGSATELRAGSAVTLTGGGNIVLNHANARISAVSLGLLLTNIDNTISGTGNIGVNSLRVINQGLIQANTGDNLVINPSDGGIGVATFDNTGVVQAAGGVITLTGSGGGEFRGTGSFEALDGGNLIFDGSAVVQNIGSGILNSGTWRAVDQGAGANVRIQNNGTSLITTIGSAAAVELSGANSNLTVRAANVAIDSTLNNVSGSLILRDGRMMNLSGGLDNAGDILLDGTFTSLTVNGNYLQTAGTLGFADNAVLNLTGAVNDILGGVVFGNGTLNGTVNNDAGVFAPGLSPGELAVTGDYTQGAAASLSIEIGGLLQGVSYDHLLVGGDVTLDGSLVVSLWGGFTPDALDTFVILSGNTLNGVFSNALANVSVTGGGFFDVTYTGNSVILSNFNAIPEPSMATLVLVGSVLVLGSRRRRISHQPA